MTQPRQRTIQRRTSPNDRGTFSFSYERAGQKAPVSAWMLSRDEEEAAFLASTHDAPLVGERLKMNDVEQKTRNGNESGTSFASSKPCFGRVIQLGDMDGSVRRIAVRFEK